MNHLSMKGARHLLGFEEVFAGKGCRKARPLRYWPIFCVILLAACSAAPSATLVPTVALPPLASDTPAEQPTAGYAAPETSIFPETPAPSEAYPVPQNTQAYPAQETPTLAQAYPAPASPAPALAPAIQFDAERAYNDVKYQMSLGPRSPGSEAHKQIIAWMQSELAKNGWTVELQETTQNNQPVQNVIAKRGSGAPWILLGAHYDSRMQADRDPDPANRTKPVPGADDGASGVAVLMELSRVLPKDMKGQVWLAFIDSEDQGQLPGWDWILGSRALADSLTSKPDAVIILDMIGDANLNIPEETNSDPALTAQIWDFAARLGYSKQFIARPGYNMLDDHTPFLQKGIRAVDIIDFDYPYWHTTQDTADKVSPQSLKIVGDTVGTWLVMK